jgi:hypothetical protein
VINTAFTGNVSTLSGAGGGLRAASSTTTALINCKFIDNSAGAGNGGGVRVETPALLTVVNCLFADNWAKMGAGLYCTGDAAQLSQIINATFSGNLATTTDGGGGVYLSSNTNYAIRNGIFWANEANGSAAEKGQIGWGSSTPPTVSYTCIQNKNLISGDGNIDDDPAFRDAAHGFYQLLGAAPSPCKNTGTNVGLPPDQYDLDGDHNADEATPDLDLLERISEVTVDMGAYEYTFANCDPGEDQEDDVQEIVEGGESDCNGNWVPDDCDIADQTSVDCNSNNIPDECDIASGTSHDCNGDGIPDECGQLTADCNGNCVEDALDIQNSTSEDCDDDGVPDECEYPGVGRWDDPDDFARGTSINVEVVSGHLQRKPVETTQPLQYLWVAASLRGTAVRINTDTGAIEGEYRTAPQNSLKDPSRTTVDLDGSVWVGNRAEDGQVDGQNKGSIVKIGLVIGGHWVNAEGVPDPDGLYLSPPFEYCTCEDRDGDGLIRTSRGLRDVLLWPNSTGADTTGGVSTAEDECILRYIRTTGKKVRTLAVDEHNDLWVGGYGNYVHEKRNGFSGDLVSGTTISPNAGGYGGLVAHAYDEGAGVWREVLWSSGGYNGPGLLRYAIGGSWSITTPSGKC